MSVHRTHRLSVKWDQTLICWVWRRRPWPPPGAIQESKLSKESSGAYRDIDRYRHGTVFSYNLLETSHRLFKSRRSTSCEPVSQPYQPAVCIAPYLIEYREIDIHKDGLQRLHTHLFGNSGMDPTLSASSKSVEEGYIGRRARPPETREKRGRMSLKNALSGDGRDRRPADKSNGPVKETKLTTVARIVIPVVCNSGAFSWSLP